MSVSIYKDVSGELPEYMDGGWQTKDLDCPIEVGEYTISMTYAPSSGGMLCVQSKFNLTIEE